MSTNQKATVEEMEKEYEEFWERWSGLWLVEITDENESRLKSQMFEHLRSLVKKGVEEEVGRLSQLCEKQKEYIGLLEEELEEQVKFFIIVPPLKTRIRREKIGAYQTEIKKLEEGHDE